jgi:hypothetical protein
MHRRSALGIGLGLGALLAAPPLVQAGRRPVAATLRGPSLDLLTPEGNVLAMAKMAGDLDLRKTKYGWYEGVLIGIAPGGATRDLLGIRGMNCARLIHAEANGPGGSAGWLVLQKEVGFFTDLATGEVLEHWRNPYTDEDVEPFHIANPAVNRPIEPVVRDTRFYDAAGGGQTETRPFLLAWHTAGDRVFVEQRTHVWARNPLDPAVWKRESSGKEIQITDMQSYVLSLRELQDPALTSVPYFGHWVHWRPWQPWMLMGDRAGGCLYSATTGSAGSLEELPQDLVALVRARAPEFLVAPTAVHRSEPSLIRYMHERSPAPPRSGEP